jgi:hypothetical protein
MRGTEWMPSEFRKLNVALLGDLQTAKNMRYDIRKSSSGTNYVYGLGKAASKLKLAQAIEKVEYNDYVFRTQKFYTAQIKNMFAFVAFEAYSRLRMMPNEHRQMQWLDFAGEISSDYTADAQELRKTVKKKDLEELRKFMSSNPLRDRIQRFADGDNREVFALSYALRNGLAHGLYGSRGEFLDLSMGLQELLLLSIKNHCLSQAQNF